MQQPSLPCFCQFLILAEGQRSRLADHKGRSEHHTMPQSHDALQFVRRMLAYLVERWSRHVTGLACVPLRILTMKAICTWSFLSNLPSTCSLGRSNPNEGEPTNKLVTLVNLWADAQAPRHLTIHSRKHPHIAAKTCTGRTRSFSHIMTQLSMATFTLIPKIHY